MHVSWKTAHLNPGGILFVALAASFIVGFGYAFSHNWYLTGLFPWKLRALPKERQIVLLRDIGMRTSPVRLRNILVAAYPNQPPEQHELAHLIGETAYTRFGPKGFDMCDSSFTFACYHGVIFAAIRKYGYDEQVLQELSSECSSAGKNDTAKVSCAHGIGHGIMWVKNYDLLTSYQLCDRIFDDTTLRFFCWDGVSMENVVRRGEMAHSLSGMPWKSDDIYFPCDSVPSQYQPACVREHIFLLRLSVFNRSTERSVEYCLHFSGKEAHRECFGALGGAINQDDPTKIFTVVTECKKVPSEFVANCIGVAATHHAYAGDTSGAQDMCAALVDSQARFTCMQAISSVSGSLYVIQSM